MVVVVSSIQHKRLWNFGVARVARGGRAGLGGVGGAGDADEAGRIRAFEGEGE